MRPARRPMLRSVPALRPSMPTTGDSGGYPEQGGGDPADTYEEDARAILNTEEQNPPDLDTGSPNDDYAEGSYEDQPGAAFDNDDSDEEGGGETTVGASSYAPDAPQDSWAFRDRAPVSIPSHMYAPKAGSEEGDDMSDASDYLSALNGGMGDVPDWLKTFGADVGKSAATAALVDANKALGGAGAKKIAVNAPPPMSFAAKLLIGVAIGLPVLYFGVKAFRKSSPAVASNPRRRRNRRGRR